MLIRKWTTEDQPVNRNTGRMHENVSRRMDAGKRPGSRYQDQQISSEIRCSGTGQKVGELWPRPTERDAGREGVSCKGPDLKAKTPTAANMTGRNFVETLVSTEQNPEMRGKQEFRG